MTRFAIALAGYALLQGPLSRILRVSTVEVHTVQGPVRGRMELVDAARATTLFGELAAAGQHARDRDRAHRWAAPRDARPLAVPVPVPEPVQPEGSA